MQNFGILFIVFGIGVFLMGIYFYTGHFNKKIFWRAMWKNMTKPKIINVGRATIGVSIPIILTGISSLFFEQESIIPLLVLIISLLTVILFLRRYFKKKRLESFFK